MSEVFCKLCKTLLHGNKFNIDDHYTKYTNILYRTFLNNIFQHQINLAVDFNICQKCYNLLNELDFAENTFKKIRQTVLNYYDSNYYVPVKVNAYSQTDNFIESKIKIHNKDEVSLIKKFECYVCFKKFVSDKSVILHIKKQHHSNGISNEVFVKSEELSNLDTYNGIGVKAEIEETSNYIIENLDEANNSTSINRKRNDNTFKPHKCTFCPKTWKTLGELKSHLSAHSNVRPFICEICGQAYKHKSALDVHVGMHNGIYPFICMYCKKSFTQKGALQRHLPIHTGETPFQCDLCGKRFVHHTSFNIHQLTHSGQKDYKCPQCGLALLSGSHLKRHMRVHTGERKYACNLCDKRFAERYNLASHQKLHNKPSTNNSCKRTHRCQVCSATYSQRIKLNEHIIKEHQKIENKQIPCMQPVWSII